MTGARRLRRRWLALGLLAVLAAAGWVFARGAQEENVTTSRVERRDLVIAVALTGVLRSEESIELGPPPVKDVWNFKISFMAPEGTEVRAGMPVLGFDTTELVQALQREQVQRDSAEKTLEKRQTDLGVQRREEELALAESEARLRKARLKTNVPEEISAGAELEKARIDARVAQQEIRYRTERLEYLERSQNAELEALRRQRDQAAVRVRDIEAQIAQMRIAAPRDGTVVYVTSRQGEKKKIGDSAWRAEKVVEIPDLGRMKAEAEVSEAESGRVAVGQPVTLRLDAFPDREYSARVRAVRGSVQQRSQADSRKVVRLTLGIEETDTERMRPGMRFTGQVEVERVPDALVVPLEAVVPGPEGAAVYVDAPLGPERRLPELGRRNDRWVEVLAGLEAGDRVLLGGPKQ